LPCLLYKSKFKRLKQGHRDERSQVEKRGINDIFSDEEEDEIEDRRPRTNIDEFEDFIELDEFSDDERDRRREEEEVARPGRRPFGMTGIDTSTLDETSMEDYRAAFGTGDEYAWALELQDNADEEQRLENKDRKIKDVFEPSQLADRMLTDEDNAIRGRDIPERFQIARKGFVSLNLTKEQDDARTKEEAKWISNLMFPKKRLDRFLAEPFETAVGQVLEFLNKENLEVPFIFQHRRDYIIHEHRGDDDNFNNGANQDETVAARLLSQNDMWDVFELDLRFRGFIEKRNAVEKIYGNLKTFSSVNDAIIEEMLPKAVTMEEIQDIQEYLHFQYSAEVKDFNALEAAANGTHKRSRQAGGTWDKIRASRAYNFARAVGLSADNYALAALGTGDHAYTEDPADRPDDLADSLLDPPEYSTGTQVMKDAKALWVEELAMSPRMRNFMRKVFYENGVFDCIRTEKGARQIAEEHRYYEFKYLRGQDFSAIARKPEMFLRMLKAEAEGLVDIKIRILNSKSLREKMYSYIESTGYSEVAESWNVVRRELIDAAVKKLEHIIGRGVKEALKSECENTLVRTCRDKYAEKLDQAPFKPQGMSLGTSPSVMTFSSGEGVAGRDAVCWIYLEHDGRVIESGKFIDLKIGNAEKFIPDGKDVEGFIDLIRRRMPDVIGVSGFSVETRKLYKDLQEIVEKNDLRPTEEDEDDNDEALAKIEVVMVNDEVARLYHASDRAIEEFPNLVPNTRYCVGLARYLRNPLLEYASLGKDITSIPFDPNQDLIPTDKLLRHLETAIVDMVNLVGVDLEDAIVDPYVANLLPYVCGLGPRKASALLEFINLNGGIVNTRKELLRDELVERTDDMTPGMGPLVWNNCASFIYLPYQEDEVDSDYLDNTRIHPEDYEIARKIAADALDLDEEDVKAEVDEGGPSAVVRRLLKENETNPGDDKLQELVLERYAEELERKFNQRKRATLETIRAELQMPYEELRRQFAPMTSEEIFTMLTGETRETLSEGMVIPVKIKKVFADHIEVKLECGIEGGVSAGDYTNGVGGDGVDPRQVYSFGQTVQARLNFLNKKSLTAQLTFKEDALRRTVNKHLDRMPGEWDDKQEAEDKRAVQKEKETKAGRAQRVIKHPLFRPFGSAQAEEYLGSKGIGDVVIRPSSKGLDHLAITWKVADNVYQHIDVLELNKENEFAVGRTLRIGSKYTYGDLDELIVNHIKATSKKVDEIMNDEKYKTMSKTDTGK
jgi:transcription elongation factor SPT6